MTSLVATEFQDKDLSFVIEKATPFVLRSPIATPVQTSFGTMYDRPALYLLLEDSSGQTGIGEVWCNFPSCGAEHRAQLLETAILPALIKKEFTDPQQCFHTLQQQFQRLAIQAGEPGPIAQSICGIDIALWDLVSKRHGLPLYKLFAGTPDIDVYASGINPTDVAQTLSRCQNAGYKAFKLKIGFGDDIDYPNIEHSCASLGPGQKLMVDANQAWTVEQALQQVTRLADYPLQWLEEPVMADTPAARWSTLAAAAKTPLAAGENISDQQAFLDANASDWLAVMQPDMCKWGGFSGVLPIAKNALDNGKRYCPHFLGGGVGLAASAHLLAAVGGDGALEIDCNPNPLREALFSPVIEDGKISIGEQPGLGLDPDALSTLLAAGPYQQSKIHQSRINGPA